MHYVMSDIHGQYNKYLNILEQISMSGEDKLYIIGDVIDRGPDVANLLLDVLTDSRVIYMLGNHELMMINSLRSIDDVRTWFNNGAEFTIDQLTKEGVDYKEIIPFMRELPVIIPDMEINGRIFHLSHAAMLYWKNRPEKTLYMNDLDEFDLERVVWSRDYAYHYPTFEENKWLDRFYPNTTFLIGHTPVYGTSYGQADSNGNPVISIAPDGRLINLDCGCAGNKRLGCLRLEDMKEFYA